MRRLLVLVVFFGATAPVLGGGAAPPDLIAAGVTIAGIPVGGMSSEQAAAVVAPAFARPVRIVYGNRQGILRPSRFGAEVSVADGVTQALAVPARTAVALKPRVDVAA